MTLPKHKNPTRWEKRREAIAPYNFVPLPDKVATLPIDDLPSHAVYESHRLSGVIECELTTASPLYIRGSLTPEQLDRTNRRRIRRRLLYQQQTTRSSPAAVCAACYAPRWRLRLWQDPQR